MRTRYKIYGTREPHPEFRGTPLDRNHCQEFYSAAAEIDGDYHRSAGTAHSSVPIDASLRVTCDKIQAADAILSRIGPGFGQQQPNESQAASGNGCEAEKCDAAAEMINCVTGERGAQRGA